MTLLSTPSDIRSKKFPISIKGVVIFEDKVVLLENERDEWELPGGKIEHGEQPPECVAREIKEELNIDVIVSGILDSWMYDILGQVEVLIVTYLCIPVSNFSELKCSHEHKRMACFSLDEVQGLNMPDKYKRSIQHAYLIISQ